MLYLSYPPTGCMPIANVIPLDEGHEPAIWPTRYVVGPVKPDDSYEDADNPRQRFY